MKKILTALMALTLMLGLAACNGGVPAIEDHEWKMEVVMRSDIEAASNEDTLIVAAGEASVSHPDAKIVDITLVAGKGTITLTDSTNHQTYSGTYTVQQKSLSGTDYEVTIAGSKGHATAALTKYADGSQVPTLPVHLGEHSLYFIAAQ